MARIHTRAERIIDAEPTDVWAALTDYADVRPRILPENYLDYRVMSDDSATGATVTYRLRAGGRERDYHIHIEETAPGQALTEHDQLSSYVTQWTVERVGPGAHTRVRLESEWESRASGVSGFFERRFAPIGVRRIHQETLVRLGELMHERQPATAGR